MLIVAIALVLALPAVGVGPAAAAPGGDEPPVEPAGPAQYPKGVAERIIRQIYQDREREEQWLHTNSESYLAAVARAEFGSRPAVLVGQADDCDLRLDDPSIQPHHLRITVVGDSFRVEALDEGARFKVAAIETTTATVAPGTIKLGRWDRFTIRMSHQNAPALILYDGQSPHFKRYRGLKHFPVDLAYRYTLSLTPKPDPDTVMVETTRGVARPAVRLGWFDFLVGKKRCRLEALHLIDPQLPPDDIAVFFRDATAGKETYDLGRYLRPQRLGASGKYLLDFNLASNPVCAVSEFFSCPIPPKANTLKVPIPAGEKDLHYLDGKR